jgi:hypothetical protein
VCVCVCVLFDEFRSLFLRVCGVVWLAVCECVEWVWLPAECHIVLKGHVGGRGFFLRTKVS